MSMLLVFGMNKCWIVISLGGCDGGGIIVEKCLYNMVYVLMAECRAVR